MTDLVEPILRGIAHPHTALTEEELAQMRADLELAEPKKCTSRIWMHTTSGTRPVNPPCENTAVEQRLAACGYVGYRCAEHQKGHGYPTDYCPGCGGIFPVNAHTIAVLPL